MKILKVLTFLGTRPEIIRLSRTMTLLDQHVDHVIVHTGQNYDYELNEIFWDELELRRPNHFLDVDRTSLGASVGDIIRKSEQVLLLEKPDAVLVLGDTNSCLAAYMAKRLHIPIFHMEAGNRCFDQNVPEETNRKIIDHIADFNLVYTEHARRHLLSEGYPHRRVYLTGSPMREVLDHYKSKIDASMALEKLDLLPHNYFLVSSHREENVDSYDNLTKILDFLQLLSEKYKFPIIFSTHPRTRKRIEASHPEFAIQNPSIKFLKPFGFIDYVKLQMNAKCVVSDSGTISEESAILSFPAISLRQSMERPEAQDAGTIILSGLNPELILNSLESVIKEYEMDSIARIIPADYSVSNTSWRVLKLILGNSNLSNKWWGIYH